MASLTALLEQLLARKDLAEADAAALMRALTDESLPPAMAAALLVTLRAKGETAAEVRGFATAMRALARRFELPPGLPAADIVGTGGDGSGSLNLSTGTALVAAACGMPIVKHGNRSVSSKSGSADVLEALGVPLPADPEAARARLDGRGFHVSVCAELSSGDEGHRAGARRARRAHGVQHSRAARESRRTAVITLIGAFDIPAAKLMADTLAGMPIQRASSCTASRAGTRPRRSGPFTVFDVRPGDVRRQQRDPAHYGIPAVRPADLAGGDAAANAAALEAVLRGVITGRTTMR